MVMPLTQIQQIYEAIKNSNSSLIIFGSQNDNFDSIASSLALSLIFEKLDKKHEVAGPHFILPKNLSFLPKSNTINKELLQLRKFIISLDLKGKELNSLNYHVENNHLHIAVQPKHGQFDADNIKTLQTEYKHNLILTLNTADLESLSHIYEKNTDFFYQTPIINIDHSTENEHYGHYNCINVTATSVAEILFDIIEKIDINLIDEDIATCLLTGMIHKTKSFRSKLVTPKILNIASQLIASGARRDEIIKNLYQTKSVNTFKLWGRVLLKLQTNHDQTIAWSNITLEDFEQTNSKLEDLDEVTDELITNIPTVKYTVLFYQEKKARKALIKTEQPINLLESLTDFRPKGLKNLVTIELFENPPQDILKKISTLL